MGMGVESFEKDVGAVTFEDGFQEIGVGEPVVQAEAQEVGTLRYVFGMGALKFPGEDGRRVRKDVARGVEDTVERGAAHSGGLLDVRHRNAFELLFFQACAEPEHYLLRRLSRPFVFADVKHVQIPPIHPPQNGICETY